MVRLSLSNVVPPLPHQYPASFPNSRSGTRRERKRPGSLRCASQGIVLRHLKNGTDKNTNTSTYEARKNQAMPSKQSERQVWC